MHARYVIKINKLAKNMQITKAFTERLRVGRSGNVVSTPDNSIYTKASFINECSLFSILFYARLFSMVRIKAFHG